MALQQKVLMSQSLLEELQFVEEASQHGVDTCRKGHPLKSFIPYEGKLTHLPNHRLILILPFKFQVEDGYVICVELPVPVQQITVLHVALIYAKGQQHFSALTGTISVASFS